MKYAGDKEVSELLHNKWSDIISAIEDAFIDPTADMVPKMYLSAGNGGDYRAMPASLGDYSGIKWVGVFPKNSEYSFPTVSGTLLLGCRHTGEQYVAMDCATLTAYRTAATSALVAKHCAPKAESFAFIGYGLQARYHIEAYESIFGHMNMDIQLYDTNESSMFQMFNWLGREHLCASWGRNKSVKETIQDADVITTLTPSRTPYLDIHDIKSDCHINAVGADAKGKRELMTNVIDGSSHFICDDPEQAAHSGELQYNDCPDLTIRNLPELIKMHKCFSFNKGISIFDSTGVAIEDMAIAELVYDLM